jgi:hypothetical protein
LREVLDQWTMVAEPQSTKPGTGSAPQPP